MAGIYIHIPFCKTKCNYCDFYSITDCSLQKNLVNALIKELILQKKNLNNKKIETIYFGGGTPSILNLSELEKIINAVFANYKINKNVEITLEANPDDITEKYIKLLAQTPVNRISLGVQSFHNHHLKLLKRRHNAQKAIQVITLLQNYFKNIGIDLIYGIPGMAMNEWKANIEKAIELNVQHVSAYHLTFEKGTELFKQLQKGLIKQIDENKSFIQFELLTEKLKAVGFEHYEISNFAKPGYYSKHNSNYWFNKPYLGIGPSAHSYNLKERYWNISDINEYIKNINKNTIPCKKEILSKSDLLNDYIMISLRTKWGINLNKIKADFGEDIYKHIIKTIGGKINPNYYIIEEPFVKLTKKGMFVSDTIISKLMV